MKFCVIGLGRFGFQLATTLADNGMEVLAIDSSEAIVSSIQNSVTHAVCMRVHDQASLRDVGVDEMDTVIVAMGENFDQSILITALLKKRLKVKTVIARAINDIHQEILELIGADRTILPEVEIGIRFADRLSSPFIDLLRVTPNFSISQVLAPKKFVGKNISELQFAQTLNIRCIGIKKEGTIETIPDDYIVLEGDRLIFSGSNKDLEELTHIS